MEKLSIYKMVKSFAKEVKEFAKQGAPHVSATQYQKRLNACKTCPNFQVDIERCGLCGCLVEHKAKWGTTDCPDDPSRWEPVLDPNKKNG